ncbi:MAG: PqqD family protein [Acidobacteriaceae bacterium]
MYHVADHVRSVADSDGTTLLDIKGNQLLAINRTGALIWEGLHAGRSLESITASLVEATGGDFTSISKDTEEFVALLKEKGLVEEEVLRP